MTLQRQIGFWLACAFGLGLFLYLFHSVLTPFVAALILAYLLDPLVDRLEKFGMGRLTATCLVLALFVLLFIVLLVSLAPFLYSQLSGLIVKLPSYAARIQALVMEQGGPLIERFGGAGRLKDIEQQLAGAAGDVARWLGSFVASVLTGGQALLGLFSLLVLTPIIAFYLILDWDHLVARVESWLPRDHRETVCVLAAEMDRSVAGFLRGQAMICVLLGLFYAVGLGLTGLNFGVLIGILSGLISFIPFVGSITGLLLSLGVAIAQFWPDYTMILVVLGVFAAGQFIEGNILQPKLLGSAVGLHPVWLMFALLAFGALFGFVGVLLAVPLAAMIGVLVRFILKRYLESPIYFGKSGRISEPVDGPAQL